MPAPAGAASWNAQPDSGNGCAGVDAGVGVSMNRKLRGDAAPTLTPPVKPGSNANNPVSSAPVAPSNTRTCGPPPGPAPVMISARPSPFRSPAATRTPPVNAGAYAKKLRISAPVLPLNTSTCGPPPGPAPVMMSAQPSPSTSPAATYTPPVNPGV